MGVFQPHARYDHCPDERRITVSVGFVTLDDLDPAQKTVLIRGRFQRALSVAASFRTTRVSVPVCPPWSVCLPRLPPLSWSPHLGRPKEGQYDDEFSLAPVAGHVSALLDREVRLVCDWEQGVSIRPGEVVMLENIRFMPGETKNSGELARNLAGLCDIYVNDAFATAHRAQASTHGVARYAPVACAGPLLLAEIDTLTKALDQPGRPMTAIVGGAKVSDKTDRVEKPDQKSGPVNRGGRNRQHVPESRRQACGRFAL